MILHGCPSCRCSGRVSDIELSEWAKAGVGKEGDRWFCEVRCRSCQEHSCPRDPRLKRQIQPQSANAAAT
jgi:hypothetical protein